MVGVNRGERKVERTKEWMRGNLREGMGGGKVEGNEWRQVDGGNEEMKE